jgi:hypothetical protein
MSNRTVCFQELQNISLTEHLLLLCQILDAATEGEVLESELTDVA